MVEVREGMSSRRWVGETGRVGRLHGIPLVVNIVVWLWVQVITIAF